MDQGLIGRLLASVNVVLAAEKLDEAPEPPVGRSRASLLGMLTAREELPADTVAATGKGDVLSWLFGAETLPLDPPLPPSGRASFLGTLLAGEQLPEDPAPGAGAVRTRGGRG